MTPNPQNTGVGAAGGVTALPCPFSRQWDPLQWERGRAVLRPVPPYSRPPSYPVPVSPPLLSLSHSILISSPFYPYYTPSLSPYSYITISLYHPYSCLCPCPTVVLTPCPPCPHLSSISVLILQYPHLIPLPSPFHPVPISSPLMSPSLSHPYPGPVSPCPYPISSLSHSISSPPRLHLIPLPSLYHSILISPPPIPILSYPYLTPIPLPVPIPAPIPFSLSPSHPSSVPIPVPPSPLGPALGPPPAVRRLPMGAAMTPYGRRDPRGPPCCRAHAHWPPERLH